MLQHSPTLSNELQIVLIVLGVVLLIMLVLLFWKKRCYHHYIKKHRSDETSKTSKKKQQKTNKEQRCSNSGKQIPKINKEPSNASTASTPVTEVITVSSKVNNEKATNKEFIQNRDVCYKQSEKVQTNRPTTNKINNSDSNYQNHTEEKNNTRKKQKPRQDSCSSVELVDERTKYKQKRQNKSNNKPHDRRRKQCNSDSSLEFTEKLQDEIVAPSRYNKKKRPCDNHSQIDDIQCLSNRYYTYH